MVDNNVLIEEQKKRILFLEEGLQQMQEELDVQSEELEAQLEELRLNNDELENAALSLRESERKYRIVADNTFDWEFWVDTDGKYLYSSPSCLEMTGYSAEEFINDPDLKFQVIYEEDLPAFRKHHFEEARHGKPDELEYRIITKDGKTKWIDHVCQPVREEGRYIGTRGCNRDITERKRAEDAARASDVRFRSLIQNASDIIRILDREGRIIYDSPSSEKILGYPPGYTLGKSPLEFMHPDDRARMEKELGEVYDSKNPGTMSEFRLRKADGEYLEVESTGRNMIGVRGVDGIVVTTRPITERKLAEQKIAYIASFPELNTNPIIEIDDIGRIIYTNPAADRLFPDLRTSGACHKMLDGVGPGMIKQEEKSPIVRDVFVNGAYYQQTILYMPEGRTFRIYAINITERKIAEESLQEKQEELEIQAEELEAVNEELRANNEELLESKASIKDSEERFRALADNIPNLAWMADAKGWIFWYNKRWYDYTGTTLGEMQGWGWQKVHHPDYLDAVTKEWSASISAGKPYDNIFPLRGKDGNYRWFLTRVSPIRDENGNIVRWFGTNTDITERKQMEEDLKVAKEQADMYLDLMGHDISNMHQIIMGQLELAQEILETDCKLDAVDKTLIDTSLETLDRSARLIDNVRNLQKLSHGEFREEIIDLDGLLLNVIREFDVIVPDESIKLVSNGLHYVKANKLLHDVFTNIIGNAIKHSNNHIDIAIKLDNVNESGKNYYRVSIEDKGPGISDDMKEKVFNRLQRGRTEARGVGLGLYLVKTLVESFGGFVKVEDRVQGDYTRGTKFLVYLPTMRGEL